MDDITYGSYYPADSVMHRLDPRVKLVCTLLFLVSLFAYWSISGFLLAFAWIATVATLAKIPAGVTLKGVRPIAVLLVATLIFQTLTGTGENAIATLWIFHITPSGISHAVGMALRILALVVGAAMLSYTTTPTQISDAVEVLLSPLAKHGVPIHDFAFILTSSLRFIPILLEETRRIMDAQISRGVDLDSGGVFHRIAALLPILIPVLVSAFQRAADLGVAMDSRCFRGGAHRVKMNPLVYTSTDSKFLVGALVWLAINVVVGRLLPMVQLL